MSRGASEAGKCRFDKEKVLYFSKDLEGLQNQDKVPSGLDSKDDQI